MKKQETNEEMERRDAAGYARIPSKASEIEERESEQVSLDDEDVTLPKSATLEQRVGMENDDLSHNSHDNEVN